MVDGTVEDIRWLISEEEYLPPFSCERKKRKVKILQIRSRNKRTGGLGNWEDVRTEEEITTVC
ncbi:hypothetical protein N9937_00930 [bacterium]|nr:hypothetical protein [bacterium]